LIKIIMLVIAVTWPLLSAGAWLALVVAGAIAFGLQMVLHVALAPWRRNPKKFLKAIAAGASARLLVVVLALIWLAVRGHEHPVAFMLGLAGLVCALLMTEATLENSNWYRQLRAERAGVAEAQAPTEGVAHR